MAEAKKKTKQSDTGLPKEAKEEKRTKSSLTFGIDIEEMTQAGVHFGHRASKVHPKIKPYLFGARNTVHVFDLEKTAEKLKEALVFIQQLISEEKILLLVGTKIQMKELVKEAAKACGLPYVSERWLGGTFTNFETIKKRIDYFKDLEEKKASGELDKYTKKERSIIDKELKDLEIKVGGIKELTRIPDAVFVLDMQKDKLAIKEAKRKGVTVIAVADTNCDPSLVDYPIPANDDAISSIKYILDKFKKAVSDKKSKAKK